MRAIMILFLSAFVFSLGLLDSLKQKKYNATLKEIILFISLLNNEIRFRQSDYFELVSLCEAQGYKYIAVSEDLITLTENQSPSFEREFKDFINKIGTTDVDGQLILCREYFEIFDTLLKEGKEKEKTKLKVNFALSTLGALSIIVIFL